MAGKIDHVRAVARGLGILKFVNSVGSVKAAEIAEALDIPRPSVIRLLRTLEEEGYVHFSSSDSRVRVTALAASLGDNATNRLLVCQVAGAVLNKFTEEHVWPIDLSIYEDGHMVIQETTHARSALSVDRGMTGFPLPMLRSSAGRAYLGACLAPERKHILELVRSYDVLEDRPFLEPDQLDEQISHLQQHGFSVRGPQTFRAKTSSIAAPILSDGMVIGCVSTIWVSKALAMGDAISLYAEPLQQVAKTIATRLEESST